MLCRRFCPHSALGNGQKHSCRSQPGCIPIHLRDRVRFKQILYKPLKQCSQVHPDGGQVTIDCVEQDDFISISVQIRSRHSREDQQVVFEEFRQIDGEGVHEGTGWLGHNETASRAAWRSISLESELARDLVSPSLFPQDQPTPMRLLRCPSTIKDKGTLPRASLADPAWLDQRRAARVGSSCGRVRGNRSLAKFAPTTVRPATYSSTKFIVMPSQACPLVYSPHPSIFDGIPRKTTC